MCFLSKLFKKNGGKSNMKKPQKRALLVGINKYKDAPLRGCVNDSILLRQMLIDRFGFNQPSAIRMLLDERATTKNIKERLEWLVDGAKAGDVLFFAFSGHGSQVVNLNYEEDPEPDGLDEILCPIDLDWEEKMITDDYLSELFDSLPDGVNLTVFLDSCHSGTGIRDIGNPIIRYRYIPAPLDILSRLGLDLTQDHPIATPTRSVKDTFSQTGILISGCKDFQTSADAFIGQQFHGAATYFLYFVLKENQFSITYKDLVNDMNSLLDKFGFEQDPQLECKEELEESMFLHPLK